jgi:hypothetical protein
MLDFVGWVLPIHTLKVVQVEHRDVDALVFVSSFVRTCRLFTEHLDETSRQLVERFEMRHPSGGHVLHTPGKIGRGLSGSDAELHDKAELRRQWGDWCGRNRGGAWFPLVESVFIAVHNGKRKV